MCIFIIQNRYNVKKSQFLTVEKDILVGIMVTLSIEYIFEIINRLKLCII